MEEKRFGVFSSSVDPNQLGNTVKAVVLGFSAFLIWLASQFGLPLTDTQLAELATAGGAAVSAVWLLFGLILKALSPLLKKK